MSAPERAVWYVAYGSNLLRARFLSYLEGNDEEFGAHVGARNRSPPAQDRPFALNHPIYFAGTSRRWGAPVTFLALEASAQPVTHGRGYLVEWTQLEDVLAQENGMRLELRLAGLPPPGEHLELATDGKYNAVLRFDDHDGHPVVTATTARRFVRGEPSHRYIETMRQGLAELGVDRSTIEAYLADVQAGSATA